MEWYSLFFFMSMKVKLLKKKVILKIDWKMFITGEQDKVSIDFPQTPSKEYWKTRFGDFDSNQINYLNGTLGNLLPLSQSINASLQNDGFDEKVNPLNGKRRGYADGSHSEIEVSKYPEWTREAIFERGMKLLKFMEERWNFKFKSKEDKLDFLGLGTVVENADQESEQVDIA